MIKILSKKFEKTFQPGALVRIGRDNTILGARCWRSFPIEWTTKSLWLHDALGVVLENRCGYYRILLLGDDFGETWCDPNYLSSVELLGGEGCIKSRPQVLIDHVNRAFQRFMHLAQHLNQQLLR